MIISKDDAFRMVDGEVSIPIDMSSYNFRFTVGWFRVRNQVTFSTFLKKRFTGDSPVNMIQIGVYEGMDLVWSLQNILRHGNSRVLAIDPWLATTKKSQDEMEQRYNNAAHNIRPYRKKVELVRGLSQEVLSGIGNAVSVAGTPVSRGSFDLVVVDGDHNKDAVYQDAVQALSLVKVGGWILFDDVRNKIYKKDHVVHGIQEFTSDYKNVKLAWYHRYMDCYEKTS